MELRIQTEACENLHLQEEQVRRDILLQNTKMLGKRESMSKLELYNIYAGYEESKPVLKDISFFVEKGEFIVLLGTSGCGKTTILNLIAGMIPISAGELYIDGVKSNDTPPRKRNIAMVFQNYALYPTMTAYENIAFPLQNAHYKKKDIDSSVKSIAVELGIDDLAKTYLNTGREPFLYYYRDKDAKEIDIVLEQDGVLNPIEIKKTSNPGTELTKVFSLLDKASVPRGKGAIVCMKPKVGVVDRDNYVVPIWVI